MVDRLRKSQAIITNTAAWGLKQQEFIVSQFWQLEV